MALHKYPRKRFTIQLDCLVKDDGEITDEDFLDTLRDSLEESGSIVVPISIQVEEVGVG